MSKRKPFSVYAAAAVLPLVILLVLPLESVLVSRLGQEITLAASPVDPIDPFRGEYIALNFSASAVPQELFHAEVKEVRRGSRWYAAFVKREDGLWTPSGVFKENPGGVCLRASVASTRGTGVTMDYGENLSRYYVSEKAARALEEAAAKGMLRARVKVWRGRAALQSLESGE